MHTSVILLLLYFMYYIMFWINFLYFQFLFYILL